MTEPTRRFPTPWHAEPIPGSYVVRDANGQALAQEKAPHEAGPVGPLEMGHPLGRDVPQRSYRGLRTSSTFDRT
jgi:hypothetical protein